MHVSFRNVDVDRLATLWNTAAPPPFCLPSVRFRTHMIGCPTFDWGASAIELDGNVPSAFVAVKRSAASLYPGPDPDMAHISAFACHECEQGVDLLAYAKRVLQQRGVYRLAFGRDSMHLFPGCPDNWAKLHDFLMVEGFDEGDTSVDLTLDLASYRPPCDVADEVRPIEPATIPLLLDFLEREFPGRWHYDIAMKLDREDLHGYVFGLFLHGRCEGFALTQDASHKVPLGGAVFPDALGEDWCSLGPIGVSRGLRGQGWGDRLLASSLTALRQSGKRLCRVDWTGIPDWYGRHGFEVERRYRSMVLRLDEPFRV